MLEAALPPRVRVVLVVAADHEVREGERRGREGERENEGGREREIAGERERLFTLMRHSFFSSFFAECKK